jgi:hypothetical protein
MNTIKTWRENGWKISLFNSHSSIAKTTSITAFTNLRFAESLQLLVQQVLASPAQATASSDRHSFQHQQVKSANTSVAYKIGGHTEAPRPRHDSSANQEVEPKHTVSTSITCTMNSSDSLGTYGQLSLNEENSFSISLTAPSPEEVAKPASAVVSVLL